MNFIQTIVSATGFRDPTANADRFGLFANLFRAAADAGADVIALPAGVLSVDRDADVAGRMDDLAALANRAGVACLAGVDVCGAGGKGGWDEDELVSGGIYARRVFRNTRRGSTPPLTRVSPLCGRGHRTDPSEGAAAGSLFF